MTTEQKKYYTVQGQDGTYHLSIQGLKIWKQDEVELAQKHGLPDTFIVTEVDFH